MSARDRWSPLVRELEASGLPLSEFARLRSVNRNTLSWWRSYFRSEARGRIGSVGFTELAVVAAEDDVGDGHLVVALPRVSAHVLVDAATDLRLLRAVVEALC